MPRWRFYGSAPPPEPLLGDFQDFQEAERDGKESSSRLSRWVLAGVLLSLLVVSAVWVAARSGAPPPRAPAVVPPRVPPDLGSCRPACDYLRLNASSRSLIVYNTTWRAGLHDRQMYLSGVLAQLASLACAKVALMPPRYSLDIGHNNDVPLPEAYRWDAYFDNRTFVPYGWAFETDDDDAAALRDSSVLMDWRADADAIKREYYDDPDVVIIGDESSRTLSDEKIVADLRVAMACASNGTKFLWRMNFETTWGDRYAFWEREVRDKFYAKNNETGVDADADADADASVPENPMYAVELTTLERALIVDKRLHRSVKLWDCGLAEVTSGRVVRRLADVATSLSLAPSLGAKNDSKNVSDIFSSGDVNLTASKFAALHVRRGDMLEWCASSPEALSAFVRCALANASDADVRNASVPIVWFTDDTNASYVAEATAAMEDSTREYLSSLSSVSFGNNASAATNVLYGETIVNETVARYLSRVVAELGVDVGGFVRREEDNYLRYQVAEEMMARAETNADAFWNIHFSYVPGTTGFSGGTCGPPRGHICAEDGRILRAAKGDENALAGFESLLDVGDNAFLVGGDALVKERQDLATEALSAIDANGTETADPVTAVAEANATA